MNRNLVGSILGRSSIKSVHLVQIRKLNTEPSIGASHQVSVHLAKRLQRRFLEIDQSETRMACGGYVRIFSSVTAWPNESKFGRKHPWKVLYKECSFISDLIY
jgi:hypothetical protein